jgi:transcription-repair coupling factor (superfamily II helicase)
MEMLHVKFAAVNASPDELAHAAINPATLMKLVSRNAKRGAQFTPQGTLRWPLPSAKAEDVSPKPAPFSTPSTPPTTQLTFCHPSRSTTA